MGRVIAFKLIVAVIALALLAFQFLLWRRLLGSLPSRRLRRYGSTAYWLFIGAGQLVLWYAVLYPGRGSDKTLPEWLQPLYGVLLAINYAHVIWLLPFGIAWLLARLYRRTANKPGGAPTDSSDSISRGDFLRRLTGAAITGAHLLPAATSAAAISGIFLGSREIAILHKEFSLKALHDDLKGLRIVQISDIHVGNLIGEHYLRFTVELIKNARPDYIVVTGDIIDNNNAFLPVAQQYFARLATLLENNRTTAKPQRLLGVLGNHDLIDDGLVAAQGLADSGLSILRNEIMTIRRGKGLLQLGGLDYPPLGRGRSEIMKRYFTELQAQQRVGIPLVLLNHNPADFAYLKTQKVDLVLSGHTHGGQINFVRSQSTLFNAAGWVYKYYVDHYEEEGVQLYVNRGLGHWFPLRVNCPPEITVITLV